MIMEIVNSDIAYKYIREKIISAEFLPGAPLYTKTLSSEIGLSRTPIRDALRQLEQDGLVTIIPRMGAVVRTLSTNEFRDLSELKRVLEVHAVGKTALNRTPNELKHLHEILLEMEKWTEKIILDRTDEASLLELLREDIKFHVAIAGAAGNNAIKDEIVRLQVISRVTIQKGPYKEFWAKLSDEEWKRLRLEIQKEHQDIFTAIEDSNSAKARQAMDHHMDQMFYQDIRFLEMAEELKLSKDIGL